MTVLKHGAAVFIGFSSGMLISGAVIAFLSAIGVVTRLAQKTSTPKYMKWYESAIAIGGIFGAVHGLFRLQITALPFRGVLVAALGLLCGIFIGVLAMSLAEVLNVIPILARRARLQQGLFYFVLAIALGKMAGALLYALVPGFYTPGS